MIALFAFVLALDAGTAASPIANGAREEGAGASSPAPTTSPALRNAKAVLSDYAKAIGDERLWRKHKSLRVKRVVKVESMHFVSEDSTRIARGGKLYEESQLPDMGTFRRGSDGKTAWAEDPIGGLRVLKGAEAEDVRLGAAWDSEWHLAEIYAEAVSIPPPAGAPAGLGCECVELRKKKAQPTRILLRPGHPSSRLGARRPGSARRPGPLRDNLLGLAESRRRAGLAPRGGQRGTSHHGRSHRRICLRRTDPNKPLHAPPEKVTRRLPQKR